MALDWDKIEPEDIAKVDGQPESHAANQALRDFLHLGEGRTLTALLENYKQAEKMPPTTSFATLRKWSSKYDWPSRAISFDLKEDKRARDQERDRRYALFRSGMAMAHARLERLTALSDKLTELALSEEALWVTTVKWVDTGNDTRERVVQRRFSGAVIRQLRGVLKDIAEETSGRYGGLKMDDLEEVKSDLFDPENGSIFSNLTREERDEIYRLWNKAFPTWGWLERMSEEEKRRLNLGI